MVTRRSCWETVANRGPQVATPAAAATISHFRSKRSATVTLQNRVDSGLAKAMQKE
jgi:hypothetical protein